MQNLSTCLWFDTQAAEAAAFYVSLFPNSRIVETTYHLEGSPFPAGSVMAVSFVLDGVEILALNGGSRVSFSPAMSLVASCETQEQVDTLWRRLSEGGEAGRCGWLTDRYGVSWQVVPRTLLRLIGSADRAAAQRAVAAMMTMGKLDIAAMQRAYDGG